MTSASSLLFWSDLASFHGQFREMFEKMSTSTAEREIRTREIIANTPEAIKSARQFAALAGRFYTARICTRGKILNDSAIFNDVVALFRIEAHNLWVIRIEDAAIATTMRSLFDMAWKSGWSLSEK